MTFAPPNTDTPYLPPTVSFPDDYEQFKISLVGLYKIIAPIVNTKEFALYDNKEILNAQQWFRPNDNQTYIQAYRTVVDFGTLPNAAAKLVPHNIPDIDSETTFTRIYATASDPIALTYIPIPYALTNEIQLDVDALNVTITTSSNRTNYTRCFVILEYLKNQ